MRSAKLVLQDPESLYEQWQRDGVRELRRSDGGRVIVGEDLCKQVLGSPAAVPPPQVATFGFRSLIDRHGEPHTTARRRLRIALDRWTAEPDELERASREAFAEALRAAPPVFELNTVVLRPTLIKLLAPILGGGEEATDRAVQLSWRTSLLEEGLLPEPLKRASERTGAALLDDTRLLLEAAGTLDGALGDLAATEPLDEDLVHDATFLRAASQVTLEGMLGVAFTRLVNIPRPAKSSGVGRRAEFTALLRGAAPVHVTRRTFRTGEVVDGVAFAPNEVLTVSLGAANHTKRDQEPSSGGGAEPEDGWGLTFGWGPHRCLGERVARPIALGAMAAFDEALERDGLTITRWRWRPTRSLRTIAEVEVNKK